MKIEQKVTTTVLQFLGQTKKTRRELLFVFRLADNTPYFKTVKIPQKWRPLTRRLQMNFHKILSQNSSCEPLIEFLHMFWRATRVRYKNLSGQLRAYSRVASV